jgi:hypothetical protein
MLSRSISPCLLLLVGCVGSAVQWRTGAEPMAGASASPSASALIIRGTKEHPRAFRLAVAAPANGLPVLGAGACLESVRWARAPVTRHDIAVAWWAVRPDSSVVLRLARSHDDGSHWDSLPPADTRDHGVRGCARPAPGVAFDPVSGYTHLVYFLEPPEGSGVFYAHLMDLPRAPSTAGPADTLAMFHAPVAIVYGEGPAEASVAAHGDTVLVAYQNPNGRVPQIQLAISVTAGHTFADRSDVSGPGSAAPLPSVAIDRSVIAVGGHESPAPIDPTVSPSTGRDVVRIGTLRCARARAVRLIDCRGVRDESVGG